MTSDNSIPQESSAQESSAQIARLEVYISWAQDEIAQLQLTDSRSPRVYVLRENTVAARALLLKLLAERKASNESS